MKVRSTARRTMVGVAAAVALAAGGATAVATSAASHVSSRPAARVSGSYQAEQAARARASLLRYLSQSRPLADVIGASSGLKPSNPDLHAGATGNAGVGSFNWSGYADYGSPGTFTGISASWREPLTLCTSEQRLAAFWVGLDGYNNSTVEQDGTLAYCFEGAAYYYTWWEMYPAGSVAVGSTVRPGDLITASVTRSGTSYTLSLTDYNSPADSFSTVQTCSTCQNSSAEWIAERPAFPIGITPLSYFSDWSVTNAWQSEGGPRESISAGPNPTGIIMVDATDTYPLAVVSGLSRAGTTFTAHWLNSY